MPSITYPEFEEQSLITESFRGSIVIDQGSEQAAESAGYHFAADVWNVTRGQIASTVDEAKQTAIHPVQLESTIPAYLQSEPAEDLETLLSRVTNENMHSLIDWGRPMGHEEW
jgi:hypothetical protein